MIFHTKSMALATRLKTDFMFIGTVIVVFLDIIANVGVVIIVVVISSPATLKKKKIETQCRYSYVAVDKK